MVHELVLSLMVLLCSQVMLEMESPILESGSLKMTGWSVSYRFPERMFFNTGITTYIWIVTNKKSKERRGKVQLIDGSSFKKCNEEKLR